MGYTFSTPTPARMVRTVKVAPGSEPCLRAITKPANGVLPSYTFIFAPGFIFLRFSSEIMFLCECELLYHQSFYFANKVVDRNLHFYEVLLCAKLSCLINVGILSKIAHDHN